MLFYLQVRLTRSLCGILEMNQLMVQMKYLRWVLLVAV